MVLGAIARDWEQLRDRIGSDWVVGMVYNGGFRNRVVVVVKQRNGRRAGKRDLG